MFIIYAKIHWCAKIKDKVEKLAYQLNEEAERTERPIRRLSQKKQATGRPISRFTVARRLHGGGLFARRLIRCVPLTPAHRRRRFLWCRKHRKWRDNEWGRVLFTDESRFSLNSDSHRILIWRERGSRNHPSNIIERDRYRGRGVLVWGGIILGSRTDLHIFDAGSVNGTRYCNEILLPYVRLFRGAMGLQFLFMDDNAPCHRTVAAKQLLDIEDIEPRRSATRTLPPVTIRELQLALRSETLRYPQSCGQSVANKVSILGQNRDGRFRLVWGRTSTGIIFFLCPGASCAWVSVNLRIIRPSYPATAPIECWRAAKRNKLPKGGLDKRGCFLCLEIEKFSEKYLEEPKKGSDAKEDWDLWNK
ncbi:transposable element Tcb2 transposase [Trichonephila clavipes]|nr:transposable element Tcb2 transposase [Trichonephila clavipes]